MMTEPKEIEWCRGLGVNRSTTALTFRMVLLECLLSGAPPIEEDDPPPRHQLCLDIPAVASIATRRNWHFGCAWTHPPPILAACPSRQHWPGGRPLRIRQLTLEPGTQMVDGGVDHGIDLRVAVQIQPES